jgi:hypothetical protein
MTRSRQFNGSFVTYDFQVELGNAGFDESFKLAGIKVAPLAFAPAIDVSPLG